MTQEEKKLLLNDICARLPYDLVVNVEKIGDAYVDYIDWYGDVTVRDYRKDRTYSVEEVTPYLRPMSSMTEEEENEYILLSNHCISTSVGFAHIEAQILMDWLNAHLFDYRGLIEKGLALEAPEGMYKTE